MTGKHRYLSSSDWAHTWFTYFEILIDVESPIHNALMMAVIFQMK